MRFIIKYILWIKSVIIHFIFDLISKIDICTRIIIRLEIQTIFQYFEKKKIVL